MKLTKSTGNVFKDVGFNPEESESLRLKAELMLKVRDYIAKEKLTQKEAAELFCVTQPRISDLLRGKFNLFSVDMLIDMLAHTGVHFEIITRKPANRHPAALRKACG